jgi:hypothetical protein
MVQAVIDLGEHEGRIVNIVKGKYGLKNKSEAISLIVKKFEETFLEPEVRPEYLENLSKIQKGKYTKFSSVDELRKELEND